MLMGMCVSLSMALLLWPGQAIVAAPGLEGAEWRLIEVNGVAVPQLSGSKQPSLMLDGTQKRATGHTGCNAFFGTYTLDGASITFGPIGATRQACPEPETGVETAFLKALDATRQWRIEDGALVLMDGHRVLGRFRAGSGSAARSDLASLTYRLTSLLSGRVTLAHGEYRAPAAPGAASEIVVTITDAQDFGSVQGREAGAVVLVASLGGTGSFYELALLLRGEKGWENRDTVLLGDRVQVRSLTIRNDRITVALTTHGPKDPLCCPTLEVTKRFSVQDDRLVAAAEGHVGGNPQIIGTVWQWMQTLYNNDTKTVPAKPESYTIRFLENGSIDVKADCNLKGGTYITEGKTVSIQITHSTMAACEPGSLEDTFVRDLEGGAIFFLKDGDLYIDLKYDSGTMKFARQKEE